MYYYEDKNVQVQVHYFTLFAEKLINIVYRHAEIKKNTNRNQLEKNNIYSCTVTKAANELSSWSLSCVDISWRWPPVKVKNAKHRLKTCNETMLHEKLRVFVSRISQPQEILCRDVAVGFGCTSESLKIKNCASFLSFFLSTSFFFCAIPYTTVELSSVQTALTVQGEELFLFTIVFSVLISTPKCLNGYWEI